MVNIVRDKNYTQPMMRCNMHPINKLFFFREGSLDFLILCSQYVNIPTNSQCVSTMFPMHFQCVPQVPNFFPRCFEYHTSSHLLSIAQNQTFITYLCRWANGKHFCNSFLWMQTSMSTRVQSLKIFLWCAFQNDSLEK